jgi:hypothetical protein
MPCQDAARDESASVSDMIRAKLESTIAITLHESGARFRLNIVHTEVDSFKAVVKG